MVREPITDSNKILAGNGQYQIGASGNMLCYREVVQIDINDIALGGGCIHYITQQQPA